MVSVQSGSWPVVLVGRLQDRYLLVLGVQIAVQPRDRHTAPPSDAAGFQQRAAQRRPLAAAAGDSGRESLEEVPKVPGEQRNMQGNRWSAASPSRGRCRNVILRVDVKQLKNEPLNAETPCDIITGHIMMSLTAEPEQRP